VADQQYYNANTKLWAITIGLTLWGSGPLTFWQWGPNVHRPPLFNVMLLYMACNPYSISFADSGNSACTTISVDTLMIISINIDFIRLLFDRINCIKMLAQTHAESTRGKGRKDN